MVQTQERVLHRVLGRHVRRGFRSVQVRGGARGETPEGHRGADAPGGDANVPAVSNPGEPRVLHPRCVSIAVHIRSAAGTADDHPVRGRERGIATGVFPSLHLSRAHEPTGDGGDERDGDLSHR